MDGTVPDAVRLRTDKANLNHAFEETLRSTHRMALVYSLLDDKSEDEREAIRERASELRDCADEGNL
jgi:deoxyribodipyrimidine photolyase-like uncharacterized protein